ALCWRGPGPRLELRKAGKPARRLLLLDDPDLDLRANLGVQTHRHVEDAERLDRLLEVDLTAIDDDPLRGELLGDVGRGDRAEELAFLARAGVEGERDALERLRLLLRGRLLLGSELRGLGLLGLDAA